MTEIATADPRLESPTTGESEFRVSLAQEGVLVRGGLELLADWSRESDDHIWIDIRSTDKDDVEPLLEEWFGFHELAAEDSLSRDTLPKHDRFGDYDFLVFRSIAVDLIGHGVDSIKLACFIGKNFLFTIHPQPLGAVDAIWGRLPQDRRMLERGVDFLLYSILDTLVDLHFPLLDEIEDRLDQIQELIFSEPSQSLLDELLHIKRDLNVMRRQSLPQRELFNQISRGDSEFIKEKHKIYFRDLYDHMYRIGESIDIERDLTTATMEAYLSVIANRTNEIMKVLTIFSSIILPMNFIASIYGMNFEHMPELKWHFGYAWAFGLMVSFAIFMLIWFWRRGWLFQSRKAAVARKRKIQLAMRRRNAREASKAITDEARHGA